MTRNEILRDPAYWAQHIQIKLFDAVLSYMDRNNLNRSQLAQKLGVSKGYVSQLFNGDCDHKLSKLVSIALACEMVPDLRFRDISQAEDVVASNAPSDVWVDSEFRADSVIIDAASAYTPQYLSSFANASILSA